MNLKELTKTFMMILNYKTICFPWFIQKYFSALRVQQISFNPLILIFCTEIFFVFVLSICMYLTIFTQILEANKKM